ncbi:Membrane-anchored ribosome-binding protein, inhibits growth in stationary phase, ElaB/YqjD/DUF883 family [Tranquillimonas rosea]|uniref:Membrane-anchored ribosome-binding protein, inhibits growth in stationary phase, ElaB/YqjD/DUF883 family n=1 Tax=Tranquillimonas rosea TaxID=641238 RepID=A0A1H9U8K4_9RHOB|nr:DUF883 family protein [Tranquillimonas rosea]SES05433.1 Membrane-anchored ribosome-binding protein, inhibits growth in stationary phase, ElaB/YqjD/DUF883 family [Tranquillimonas rosea]
MARTEDTDTSVKHIPHEAKASKNVSQDDLKGQVEQLRSDIEALTGLLGRGAREQYDSARGAARDHARQARDTAGRQYDDALRVAEGYYTEAEQSIRRNPTMAVGIATGIGFLIGLIATRR